MSGQVYGGTGGGACPRCGQYSNACRCHAQAEEQAKAMADVMAIEPQIHELSTQLLALSAKVDAYKVKCPTCRCRILPWAECRCCAEPACMEDEPAI